MNPVNILFIAIALVAIFRTRPQGTVPPTFGLRVLQAVLLLLVLFILAAGLWPH